MATSARAEIFARIRHACKSTPAATIAGELRSLGVAPAAPLPGSSLQASFLTNILKNQGTVACAPDRGAAVKAISEYLYEHYRSHRLVASNDPRLAAMPWRDAGVLPRFGEVEPGEQVAVSYAQLGIAEIGAIVTFTGKTNPAANNLLPEHHIVLVDSKDIVPDMEAAWQQMQPTLGAPTARPRGINWIAGPSSTADIEGTLVYGAHGPRGWHVILLGDTPAEALDEARSLAGR
tara:strand:+ start:67942 stop:68643 length:702 start_codon:yes stop_codon:yes gene_type:complete